MSAGGPAEKRLSQSQLELAGRVPLGKQGGIVRSSPFHSVSTKVALSEKNDLEMIGSGSEPNVQPESKVPVVNWEMTLELFHPGPARKHLA